jgi:deoxycytidine triphosphate deaminase
MSILSDGMIEPFVEAQRRDGCISYGLSSYGYDARVADEFKIFTNVDSAPWSIPRTSIRPALSIARPMSA